jgi:hypothetical protein
VVKEYTEETERNAPDENHLRQSKREYQEALVRELFSFKAIKYEFGKLNRLFLEHSNTLSADGMNQFKALTAKAEAEVFSMADKFLPQLQAYFSKPELPEENESLRQRLQKAGVYFSQKLKDEILPEVKNIHLVTDNKVVMKTAHEHLDNLQKEIFSKNACFTVCHSGFSTHACVRAKTNAELDFQSSRKAAPATMLGVPKNAPHPELYARLLRWRKELAEEMEMELYEILSTRSLLELVQFLPTDSASLKRIKGIGEVKVKHFGADLIGMIEKYCVEKGIPANLLPPPEPPKPPKPDTKFVSLELYKSGKSLDEIAAERGFAKSTIEGHLAHFIGTGELDISAFLKKEQVAEIENFFTEKNTVSTAEAKAYFGERYSYGEFKMVLEYLKKNDVP